MNNFTDKNGMWKDDEVGIDALHEWVRSRYPKPEFCMDCGVSAPRDLANISGNYSRDLSDWEWLCRRCHMLKDGRLKKFVGQSGNMRGKKQTTEHAKKRAESRKNGAGYNQPRGYHGRFLEA